MSQQPTNYAGMIGWSVGRAEWLDDPASKVNRYWRAVEYGATGWVGDYVVGLWGGRAEPRKGLWGSAGTPFSGDRDEKLAPYFSKRGQNLLGAARKALWEYMQGGKGPNMDRLKVREFYRGPKRDRMGHTYKPGRWETVKTEAQRKTAQGQMFHYFMTRAQSVDEIPFVVGRIQQPTQPEYFYQRALMDFDIRGAQEMAIREAFSFALQSAPKSISRIQHLQNLAAFDSGDVKPARGLVKGSRRKSDAFAASKTPHNTAMVSFAASVEVQSLIFEGRGKFVAGAWQQAIREANERVAMAFQEAVVAQMRKRAHRPETRNLQKATADPRNRYPRDKGRAWF